MGGLGLYSATRTKEAAYWAAWADLLPVIHARAPALAQEFVTQLEHGPAAVAACLQQADQAGRHLDLHGWAHRPPWTSLIGDAAPPPPLADREPAWWRHGWQHPASVAVTTYHRQECVLPSLSPTHRALLRSQAGPAPGHGFSQCHLTLAPHCLPRHEHRPPAPAPLTSASHCRHLWRRRPRAWLWRAPRPIRRPRARLSPLGRLGATRASRRACLGAGCARGHRR